MQKHQELAKEIKAHPDGRQERIAELRQILSMPDDGIICTPEVFDIVIDPPKRSFQIVELGAAINPMIALMAKLSALKVGDKLGIECGTIFSLSFKEALQEAAKGMAEEDGCQKGTLEAFEALVADKLSADYNPTMPALVEHQGHEIKPLYGVAIYWRDSDFGPDEAAQQAVLDEQK